MLLKKEQKKILGLQDSENYVEMNYPGDPPSFQKVSQQGTRKIFKGTKGTTQDKKRLKITR